MDTVEVTVWVLVDEDGDYVATTDADKLAEVYDDEIGGDRDALSLRRVKVTLRIPKPAAVELVADVPAEPTTGELKVA